MPQEISSFSSQWCILFGTFLERRVVSVHSAACLHPLGSVGLHSEDVLNVQFTGPLATPAAVITGTDLPLRSDWSSISCIGRFISISQLH